MLLILSNQFNFIVNIYGEVFPSRGHRDPADWHTWSLRFYPDAYQSGAGFDSYIQTLRCYGNGTEAERITIYSKYEKTMSNQFLMAV